MHGTWQIQEKYSLDERKQVSPRWWRPLAVYARFILLFFLSSCSSDPMGRAQGQSTEDNRPEARQDARQKLFATDSTISEPKCLPGFPGDCFAHNLPNVASQQYRRVGMIISLMSQLRSLKHRKPPGHIEPQSEPPQSKFTGCSLSITAQAANLFPTREGQEGRQSKFHFQQTEFKITGDEKNSNKISKITVDVEQFLM